MTTRSAAAGVLTVVCLAGCFPSSELALKQSPTATERFEVPEGYQSVYRKVAANMRRCYETAWVGDSVRVRAEIFTDINTAEIAAEGINAILGRRIEFLVELRAIGEGRTEVSAYQGVGTAGVGAVRRWVDGDSEVCAARRR